MNMADLDYELPESLIAQTPIEPRDAARLLVLDRKSGQIEHRIFREIGEYLQPGDLLILNQTRVIPARLYARKPTGGRVELLLLRRCDDLTWEALVGGKGLRIASRIKVEDGPEAEIIALLNGAGRVVLRKGTAAAHYIMGGPTANNHNAFTLGTPTTEIYVMHGETAAVASFSRRLVKEKDSGRPLQPIIDKMNKLARQYYEQSRPIYCARRGFVDEVVRFEDLRRYLQAFTACCYQNPISICPHHHMMLPRLIRSQIVTGLPRPKKKQG